MPPDEAPKGQMKCFFCDEGKEIPFNPVLSSPSSPEEMMKDIQQMSNLIKQQDEYEPVKISCTIQISPKKAKMFREEMMFELCEALKGWKKYRNPKIHRRHINIRRAYRKYGSMMLLIRVPKIDLFDINLRREYE